MKFRKFKICKLVRDKIPEFLKKNNIEICERKINIMEHIKELEKKMFEEIKEVLDAKSKEELTIELADVFEVLITYSKLKGIALEDIESKRIIKKEKFGGFEKGYYTEFVNIPENNKNNDKSCNIDYYIGKYEEIK